MEITFRNKKLEKLANDYRKCQKEFGEIRAKLYHRRLQDLQNANTLDDVKYMPGNYHDLVGNRKGKWGCDLDQPYRLVFEPHENPIPKDEHRWYIWSDIKGVEIIEIINYHKEK